MADQKGHTENKLCPNDLIYSLCFIISVILIFFLLKKMSLYNFNANYTYFQIKKIENCIDFINNFIYLK